MYHPIIVTMCHHFPPPQLLPVVNQMTWDSWCFFTNINTGSLLPLSLSRWIRTTMTSLSHFDELPRQLPLCRLEGATAGPWQLGNRCQVYLPDTQKDKDNGCVQVLGQGLLLEVYSQRAAWWYVWAVRLTTRACLLDWWSCQVLDAESCQVLVVYFAASANYWGNKALGDCGDNCNTLCREG